MIIQFIYKALNHNTVAWMHFIKRKEKELWLLENKIEKQLQAALSFFLVNVKLVCAFILKPQTFWCLWLFPLPNFQPTVSVIYLSACERHPLASLNQTHCGRVLTWANHQSHARRGRKLPQLTSSSLNEERKFWRLGGLMSQWSGVLIRWACHWR